MDIYKIQEKHNKHAYVPIWNIKLKLRLRNLEKSSTKRVDTFLRGFFNMDCFLFNEKCPNPFTDPL